MNFDFIDLGEIEYQKAWEIQKELVTKRIHDEISDTIVFCHHPQVVTLGRASQREKSLLVNCPYPVIEIERGGYATYHGPGQIVIYPIVKLGPEKNSQFTLGLKNFICFLEQKTISLLKNDYNLSSACRVDGKIGVWLHGGEKKIASIGIAIKHWVSYHGMAFNFNTPSEVWQHINPCGFNPTVMTDLKKETGLENLTYEQLKQKFTHTLSS